MVEQRALVERLGASMSRAAWQRVTWQPTDRYTVDGDALEYDDPGEAKRVAEERHVLARRVSDGKPINFYASEMKVPEVKQ